MRQDFFEAAKDAVKDVRYPSCENLLEPVHVKEKIM